MDTQSGNIEKIIYIIKEEMKNGLYKNRKIYELDFKAQP